MSVKPIVLVIEGSTSEGETLSRVLDSSRYHTVFVESPEDAMAHIESPVDLVLSGVAADEPLGRELLERWKARRPEIPFVMMASLANVDAARQAVERGAAGYITRSGNDSDFAGQLEKWLVRAQQSNHSRSNGNLTNASTYSGTKLSADAMSAIRIPPGTTLEELERVAVQQSLEQHHGNRTHAAKELGISVRTLQRKLKAWGEMRAHAGDLTPMREPTMRNEPNANGRSWNANPAGSRQPTHRPRLATV